jgi:hypothetical protein
MRLLSRIPHPRITTGSIALAGVVFLALVWLAQGATECASAQGCTVDLQRVIPTGLVVNEDRGATTDHDLRVHGDSVDDVLFVDASTNTAFLNGTVDGSGAIAVGFSNLVGIEVITATGDYDVPTGVSTLLVYCTGGGGGGGGWADDTTVAGVPGGGGGGGGTGVTLVDASGTASYAVTMGAPGTGGAEDANGTSGTSTTFGSECSGDGGSFGMGNPEGVAGNGGGCTADFCIAGGEGRATNAADSTTSNISMSGGGTWQHAAGSIGLGSQGGGGQGGNSSVPTAFNGDSGRVVVFEFN